MKSKEQNIQRKKTKRFILWLLFLMSVFFVLYFILNQYILVRDIVFTGNNRLTNEELNSLVDIKKKSRIFEISGKDIYKRLTQSQWVKNIVIRKELTGRILINITESEPLAILQIDKTYLIDQKGIILEELKEGSETFLPIINNIDPITNKITYFEIVNLLVTLNEKNISYKGNLEIIATNPNDITLKIDNILIIIGSGDYDNKLEKLRFVRDEINKKNIVVDYIDARFINQIIVKER